jgi:type IV pilus assembly protein PilC
MKNHIYCWSAKSITGEKYKGQIHAVTPKLAKIKLEQKGYIQISLKRQYLTWGQRKISAVELAAFYRQLATLLQAGVDILTSCHILTENQHNLGLAQILIEIKRDIESGLSFKDSLSKHSQIFTPLIGHLIEVGELTGRLDSMLERIAHYRENAYAFKKKRKQF